MCAFTLPSHAQLRHIDLNPGAFEGVSVSGDFVLSVFEGDSCSVSLDVSEEFTEVRSARVIDSVLVLSLDEKNDLGEIWKKFRGMRLLPYSEPPLRCPVG